MIMIAKPMDEIAAQNNDQVSLSLSLHDPRHASHVRLFHHKRYQEIHFIHWYF